MSRYTHAIRPEESAKRGCWRFAAAVVLTAALAIRCAPESQPGLGNARVALSGTAAGTAFARVALTVSPGGGGTFAPIVVELSWDGMRWEAFIAGIPAGPARQFEVVASDSAGVPIFSGFVTSDVPANSADVVLQMELQPVSPPGGLAISVPSVDMLWASSASVPPGGTVTLGVSASASAGTPLVYLWQDTCSGTFAPASAPSTTWTAPAAPASCQLVITVGDGNGSSVTCFLGVAVQ